MQRELGITPSEITGLTPINTRGWAINSSFSNQQLYSFVAEISPHFSMNFEQLGATYSMTGEGIEDLLSDLTCLQCRAVLLEWWHSQQLLKQESSK